MFRKRKKSRLCKVLVVLISVAMTTAGFAAVAGAGRIIPAGKVSIIKGGKVVGEFSQEVPLPEGALLKCNAQCAVQLNDVYMVAEPDTVFSVSSMANSNELMVQEGTVYFSVTESSRPLQFDTPGGVVTTRETSLTGSELKGYVRVYRQETEIGVIQGGTMRVETASGEITIVSGNQITITVTEPATAVATTGVQQEGLSTNTKYVIGGVGTAIAAGAIFALASSGGSSNRSSGSPASP